MLIRQLFAAKKCLAPPEIQHGRVIQSGTEFRAGTVIRFECKTGEGYYRYGPSQQTCYPNSNGEMVWTPDRPVCITSSRFEEYCIRQGKVMTMDPEASCVHKSELFSIKVFVVREYSLKALPYSITINCFLFRCLPAMTFSSHLMYFCEYLLL